jgi:hypothetical protein
MKTALFLAMICSASLVGAIARAEPKAEAPKSSVFQALSGLLKSQSATQKAITQNLR